MLGSRLGTALSVSLFSPVQLVLEVKMLLLVPAGVPSLAAALGVFTSAISFLHQLGLCAQLFGFWNLARSLLSALW